MDEKMHAVLQEISRTVDGIDQNGVERFAQMMCAAPRIFFAGGGRSGLMIRALAMRAMHLGKPAYVLGEVTTPSVAAGDLLVIASGSGETESFVIHAKKAKKLGAKLATVTINPQASIGSLADCTVQIDAPAKADGGQASIQPMGSLFEQAMLLFFDRTVLRMMEILDKTPGEMYKNHANLE